MLVRQITWCSELIIVQRNSLIYVNQDIDILNDSVLTNSRDVEKGILNIKLDGVSLNGVSSTKFLGIIINENLTWKNQIDAISKTI